MTGRRLESGDRVGANKHEPVGKLNLRVGEGESESIAFDSRVKRKDESRLTENVTGEFERLHCIFLGVGVEGERLEHMTLKELVFVILAHEDCH